MVLEDLPERIARKIVIDLLGCWIWTGAISAVSGYGNAYWWSRQISPHRLAYLLLVGPIPEGMELDHLCRNRVCCNPAHLEPVTHAENMRRGSFGARTHCPRGHPYDSQNTRVTPRGHRYCRTCDRLRNRANRRAPL